MNEIASISSIIIKNLNFDLPGKISIALEDGRELIVPLKYFPEIKKMSLEKRRQFTIVDDRTILFRNSDNVYHLEDFFGLDEYWKQR